MSRRLDNVVLLFSILPAAMPTPLPSNPLDHPDLIQPRLKLEQFLDHLRDVTPQGLMPTSTSIVQYCSKPEYVTHALEEFPKFPRVYASDYTGHFAWAGWSERYERNAKPPRLTDEEEKHVCALVVLGDYQVYTNLVTLETLVRYNPPGAEPGEFVSWSAQPERTLAVPMRAWYEQAYGARLP
jgi:hypothetical protein